MYIISDNELTRDYTLSTLRVCDMMHNVYLKLIISFLILKSNETAVNYYLSSIFYSV